MNQVLQVILKKENLENLLPLFTKQNVSDLCLQSLCEDCLIKLGIQKLGDRKRLLSAFSHASDPEASGGTFMEKILGGTLPHDSLLAGQSVATFFIGKYPVMHEEWQEVKSWAMDNRYDIKSGEAAGNQCPVTMVSWIDALKWCNAKSEMCGLDPVYRMSGKIYKTDSFTNNPSKAVRENSKANGYRLPTESEWEWAARSGLCRMEDNVSESQQLNATKSHETHTLEKPLTNTTAHNGDEDSGGYGLPSNLWEWCWDMANDLIMDDNASARRLRGGCWNHIEHGDMENLRVSSAPESQNCVVSFRLARNALD